MSRAFVCMLLVAALVVSPVAGSQPTALGVVVEASRASLGTSAASPGTSVYDGDRLSTSAEGALRLRVGPALVYLMGESSITLHRAASGAQIVLTGGSVVMSTSQPDAIAILAEGATLRPRAGGLTVAQLQRLGSKELHILAQRGEWELIYDGETQVIPEGASYRVVLDPPENMPVSQRVAVRPRKSGRTRRGLLILLWGGIGGATWWAVHEAFESPDRP